MRITSIVLLIGCLQISANARSQVVTIKEKSVPIGKIFKEIKTQTGYDFLYNTLSVKDSKPVTIDMRNAPLQMVLEKCFAGQPFAYKIIDKTIIVFEENKTGPVNEILQRSNGNIPVLINITGRVFDEDGHPLAGVSINLKNNSGGSVTREDGSFSITVPDDRGILIFSFVGYGKQELSVKGKTELNVSLKKKMRH